MLSYSEVRRRTLRPNHAENVRIFYFSARVSIYLTYLLVHTRITANQVTHLFTLVGVSAGVVFLFPGFWPVLLAVALFRFHVILDVMDGEVARYRGTSSIFAGYQDYLTHYFCYPWVMFAAGINTSYFEPGLVPMSAAFLAAHAYVMNLASKDTWYRANFGRADKQDIDHVVPEEQHRSRPLTAKGLFLRVVAEATDYDGFLSLFVVAVTLDVFAGYPGPLWGMCWRTHVLILYCILFYARALLKIALVYRKGRIPRRAGLA